MIETVLAYVTILLIIILVAVVVNGIEEHNKKEKSKMSFMESMNLTGIPIVTFFSNDNKYNFILDTGANYSVINSSELANMKYTQSHLSTNVIGMEGNSQKVGFVTIDLEYKDNKFTEDFQIINMDAAFTKIKQESGASICGILGSEFFKNHKYILDFKDLIAYIKK